MPVSTTTRFGATRWSSNSDTFSRTQFDRDNRVMEELAGIALQGAASERPAAADRYERSFWFNVDTGDLDYCDGSAWTTVAGPSVDTPAGTLIQSLRATPPPGYLPCDGTAVSRTLYAVLWEAMGSPNTGNGVTTFNLPNMVDRFARGVSGTPGGTGGAASVVLTTGHMPSHGHALDHDHPSASSSSNGAHVHGTGETGERAAENENIEAAFVVGDFQASSLHLNYDGGSGGPSLGESELSESARSPHVHSDVAYAYETAEAGAHAHSVDIPAFVGSTGPAGAPSPTAVPTVPPWYGVRFYVKY